MTIMNSRKWVYYCDETHHTASYLVRRAAMKRGTSTSSGTQAARRSEEVLRGEKRDKGGVKKRRGGVGGRGAGDGMDIGSSSRRGVPAHGEAAPSDALLDNSPGTWSRSHSWRKEWSSFMTETHTHAQRDTHSHTRSQ